MRERQYNKNTLERNSNYPGKKPQTGGGQKEARLVVVMMMTMTFR